MNMRTPGPWFIKIKDEAIGIMGKDSSLIAVMRRKKADVDTRVSDAQLIAAAPLLLDACKDVLAVLENNLIVTAEGFKINDSHIRESLVDAVMRAEGYRKGRANPDPTSIPPKVSPIKGVIAS